MTERYYALTRCLWCKRHFTPRRYTSKGVAHVTQHCMRTCAQETQRMANRGKPLTAAIAARQRNCATRRAVALRAVYGPLTDRERALIKRAEKIGYDRGYNAGISPVRAKGAAA